MASRLLNEIVYEQYAGLFEILFPTARIVQVLDLDGEIVWASSPEALDEAAAAVRDRAIAESRIALAPGVVEQQESTENRVYATALGGADGASCGILLVALDGPGSRREDVAVETAALTAVATRLSQELALNAELDQMAAELTERYEELNLVYHTEDHAAFFIEGEDALKRLLKNCCEYLNVAFAALIMRDKDIHLMTENAGDALKNPAPVMERLRHALYSEVVSSRTPIAINDLTSDTARSLWLGLPHKVLACPVIDGKGSVGGILAIVNPSSAAHFSNSDKNLLSVMARKAAKIVQVNYDQLTGLMSREGFEYYLDHALDEARGRGSTHCLLNINVDQLHVVNDTLSHAAGDKVIQEMCAHLRSRVRDADLLGRIGGDDIGLLLRNCPVQQGAEVAEKLREEIAALRIPWGERKLTVTVSVGVAPITAESIDTVSVLTTAELTCKSAKEAGKNRVEVYQDDDTRILQRHEEMYLLGTIQEALRDDRFTLFAQLIEPLRTGRSGWHLELLLRMLSEAGRPVLPVAFMSAAERYHLMPALDRWVVSAALGAFAGAEKTLADQVSLCAINISGQSLSDDEFLAFVTSQLNSSPLPLHKVCFEITETAAIANLDKAARFMTALKQRGCKFALDDFGSGLSSFSYLRTLPVNYLKIDGAIVKEIANDEVAASMVAAIHQIAGVMGLETIAEFVENDAIKQRLRAIGVDFGQGFGIARPQPLDELLAELATPTRNLA